MDEPIIMQGRGRPKKGSTARTLASLGITRDQSYNWQALAEVPKEKFEAALALPDKKSRIRTLNELVRQVKREKAAGKNVVSHDIIETSPVRAAFQNWWLATLGLLDVLSKYDPDNRGTPDYVLRLETELSLIDMAKEMLKRFPERLGEDVKSFKQFLAKRKREIWKQLDDAARRNRGE